MHFSLWKHKLIESSPTSVDNEKDTSGEIIVYRPGLGFYLGMWLQTKERKIRIYGDDGGRISLIHRTFEGDRVEGPVHQHSYIELGYVIKGCARQVFSEQEYQFHEGDIWISDMNCYHSDIYFPDELFEVYIGIPSDVFDVVFLESVGASPIQQFIYNALLKQKVKRQFLKFSPRGDCRKAEGIIERIVEETDGKQIGMNNIVKGLLARLLSLLANEFDFMLANQEKVKMHQLIYDEIETHVRKNFRTVTIQNLIDKFHYNSDFYNRIIKENSGLTYSEFLQNIRLEKAESLLENTDKTIAEIIEEVGYQSVGYFYKLFQNTYHVTPVEYRKSKRILSS